MAIDVPEEITHKILCHCLCIISLHRFLMGSVISPRAKRARLREFGDHGRSNTLLVCKEWLRIGTPLFYQTILLTNNCQLQQLANTLRISPQLGELVRNVRLEGGYGKKLATVLNHFPNLHSLAVRAYSPAKHTNAGLVAALPNLKPVQLFIFDLTSYNGQHTGVNLKRQNIHSALCKTIANCTSLVRSLYCCLHLTLLKQLKLIGRIDCGRPTIRPSHMDSIFCRSFHGTIASIRLVARRRIQTLPFGLHHFRQPAPRNGPLSRSAG